MNRPTGARARAPGTFPGGPTCPRDGPLNASILAAGEPAGGLAAAGPGPARAAGALGRGPGLGVAGRAGGGRRPVGRAAPPGRAGRRGPVLVSAATSMDLVVAYLGRCAWAWSWSWSTPPTGSGRWPTSSATPHPRRRWSTTSARPLGARAAGGDLLVTGPEVGLPDGDPPPLDGSAAGDPALLCYTSGTTGASKGAVLAGNLLASAEALRLAWRWTPGDRLVLALPLFHVHGLGVGLHGTLLAGASAVLLPASRSTPCSTPPATTEATLFFGVPTMYARLARLAQGRRAGPAAAVRVRVGPAAPDGVRAPGRAGRAAGAGALRHDRDDHERVQPP